MGIYLGLVTITILLGLVTMLKKKVEVMLQLAQTEFGWYLLIFYGPNPIFLYPAYPYRVKIA